MEECDIYICGRHLKLTINWNTTLSTEVKELKGLVKKVDEMNNSVTEIKSSIKKLNNVALDLDSSSIKKPYLAYLKGTFYTYPWIVEEDEDLKI